MKKTISIILVIALLLSSLPSAFLSARAETTIAKLVGDVDRDGEITDWDGVMLARHLAGWSINVADEKLLDIDGDGEITDWDGVMFDRYLAGWTVATQVGKRLTYSITYANTKNAANINPTTYENGAVSTQLAPLSVEHYNFAGWYIENEQVTHIPTNYESDLTITAHWTPVEYTITYVNTKYAANGNPTTYNIESDEIVLQNLSCEGYQFEGWYLGDQKVTEIPSGTTGNITLTAAWSACNYSITYENTKGATNNNPNGFSTDDSTIKLTDLNKAGYTFDGWYQGTQKVTQIPSGTIGNITLTAQWTPITYTATFTAEGSIVATRYFTVEDNVLSSIPNVPSKAGYTGAWSNYNLGTSNIVIPAIYTLNEYTITYTNTKGAENSNLNNYTVITSTFQLSELQCDGYEFIGWYKGSTKVTSIEKGTTGNITLTAKWSPINYVITYTDTKGASNTNPVEYDVESGTIYLTDLIAEHYNFNGWYWNGKKVSSIPAGNIGDIELVARWTPVSYDLTYKNTMGATNTNPATYTVEDMIILQDIRADGYIFDGWYYNGEKVTKILVGSYGNKMLTAKWTPITYSITYNDEKNLSHSNPATYTIENDTIILEPLSADGYAFKGWYNGNQKVTSIPAGSFGDLVLTAKWSIITYTITYMNTKDITNNNPTAYTVEDSIMLNDLSIVPLQHGYIFEGWFDGDKRITEITAGSFGDLTLTAKWTPFVYSVTYLGVENAENLNTLTTTTVDSWQGNYTLMDPTRYGYRFNGWKIDQGNGGTISIETISLAQIKEYGIDGVLYIRAEWTQLTIIKTSEDFANIVYDMSGNYMLANNISVSVPLGDATNPFRGYFFGNGYQISGSVAFEINRGTISKLNTSEPICNYNHGTITDCSSNSGIARYNSGTIYRCTSTGYVTYSTKGSDTFQGEYYSGYVTGYGNVYQYAGGIVAYNTGSISQCSVTHQNGFSYRVDKEYSYVAVLTGYVGGFVGYSSGSISDSYYSGEKIDISCTNYSNFENSYSGVVWGTNRTAFAKLYCGGFVGYSDGSISGCYVKATAVEGYVNSTGWSASSNHYGHADGYLGGFAGYAKKVERSFCDVGEIYYYVSESYLCGYSRTIGRALASYSSKNTYGTLYYNSGCSLSTTGVNTTTTIGTATSTSNYKSRNFMLYTLGWSESTWIFTNGKLPELQWEK